MKNRILKFSQICFFLTLLAYSLVIFSCNDDDTMIGEDLIGSVDLGFYQILPESIAQLPYLDKELIVFVDSLGAKAEFKINELDVFVTTDVEVKDFDVFEPGDSVIYVLDKEIKNIDIENDSMSLCFSLSLQAIPNITEPGTGGAADILTVFLSTKALGASSLYQLLVHVTDQRDPPEINILNQTSDIEIFGRTFQDVIYSQNAPSAVSFLRFNYEIGVVAFTDLSGKTWRFEEFR